MLWKLAAHNTSRPRLHQEAAEPWPISKDCPEQQKETTKNFSNNNNNNNSNNNSYRAVAAAAANTAADSWVQEMLYESVDVSWAP